MKSISWIRVQSVQQQGKGRSNISVSKESDLARVIDADGEQLPFFVQYDHVEVSLFYFVCKYHADYSLVRLCHRARNVLSGKLA